MGETKKMSPFVIWCDEICCELRVPCHSVTVSQCSNKNLKTYITNTNISFVRKDQIKWGKGGCTEHYNNTKCSFKLNHLQCQPRPHHYYFRKPIPTDVFLNKTNV